MSKAKILVVDDSETIVALLKSLLQKEDYEVITAVDGEQGLQLAREANPNLILLDLMLPKIDGYKVCRLLKFDETKKDIPIIMLTSRGAEEDKETGKETGADAYLTKPFDNAKLLETIKTFLGG